MLLYLQITLTILSAICVALVLPLGVWLGFGWAITLAVAGFAFFMLMKLCKQTREFRGETEQFPTENSDSSPTSNPTPNENDTDKNS